MARALPSFGTKELVSKSRSEESIHRIAIMKPEDDKIVHGIFTNKETPGGSLKLTCRLYKGQKLYNKVLEDGKEYDIPLSVALHLNNQCSYPVHSNLTDQFGNPFKGIGKVIHRYEFRSTEYL